MVLERLTDIDDIKKLNYEELKVLSHEIRKFLIDKVSKKGGHLASNLGVVELTIALSRVFDLNNDKIIWDVGHQSYVYKILTGRKDDFDNLRDINHISGFPNIFESKYDSFNTGHSSTSISAGLGFVYARNKINKNYNVVSVIGDGALTGGMAFEALNNAANIDSNFIIILNDNNMSISENIGGIHNHLNALRTDPNYQDFKSKISSNLSKNNLGKSVARKISNIKNSFKRLFIDTMIFEDMGIKYLGPIDGHNIIEIEKVLAEAKNVKGPVIIHLFTKKGKGYKLAEENPPKYHGISSFDIESGKTAKNSITYTDVFSEQICELANSNKNIVALTAAMSDGTGLNNLKKQFPDRFIDAGIAEEHLVTFSGALALSGLVPFVCIYSSFLQRGYDQLISDIALMNNHVVFMIDRAGIIGRDGQTHQGLFDISYLLSIPNMTLLAPKNDLEFKQMISFAASCDGPVAIRYPRGKALNVLRNNNAPLCLGKLEVINEGLDVALFAFGSMVNNCLEIQKYLNDNNITSSLFNLRFAKPLDKENILKYAKKHKLVVTLEEGVLSGGIGDNINRLLISNNINTSIINIGIDDIFVTHGDVNDVKKSINFDNKSIADKIIRSYLNERQ